MAERYIIVNPDSVVKHILGYELEPGKSMVTTSHLVADLANRMGFLVSARGESDKFRNTFDLQPLEVDCTGTSYSVVVPVYKQVGCIPRLVQSVTEKALLEFIFVLCGDTLDEAKRLSEEAYALSGTVGLPTLCVISPTQWGIGTVRNMGIALASNPWTILIDGDDAFAPHAIAYLTNAILSDPSVDVLYGDYESRGHVHTAPDFRLGLLEEQGCYMYGLRCIRTCLLQRVRCLEEYAFAEDLELLIALEKLGARFQKVSHVLSCVSDLPSRVTKVKRKEVDQYALRARRAYCT